MPKYEVAVSGLGVASPIGLGYAEFAESLAYGVTGLGPWSGNDQHLAGEIHGFQVADWLIAEKTYLDRASELALAATRMSCLDAGLDSLPVPEERRGVVLGTASGCAATMAAYGGRVKQRGTRFATPVLFSHAFANTPASLVAIDYRLKGYHATVTSGAASGELAVTTAITALAAGHADLILAGGVEALVVNEGSACGGDPDDYDPFAASAHPPGEGAAVLLLETVAAAAARHATPRCLLALSDQPEGADLVVLPHVGAGAAPDGAAVCVPSGLYGDAHGASGALAVAVAVAALSHDVVPPVRGGQGSLAERREPVAQALRAVAVPAPGGLWLTVTRPSAG